MCATNLRPVRVQAVQLQSTSASAQSPAVDYESGMEAMVLAILQQTNYSQQSELADLAGLALQLSQNLMVEQGVLLNAYSGFLTDALASNVMVQGSLGGASTPSLLPASGLLAMHMQLLTLLTSVKTFICGLSLYLDRRSGILLVSQGHSCCSSALISSRRHR